MNVWHRDSSSSSLDGSSSELEVALNTVLPFEVMINGMKRLPSTFLYVLRRYRGELKGVELRLNSHFSLATIQFKVDSSGVKRGTPNQRSFSSFWEKKMSSGATNKRMRVNRDEPKLEECSDGNAVDWTKLPVDTALSVFSRLNYRDRANFSSTCRSLRVLGASPCLWRALDIRAHRVDPGAAIFLSRRCLSLHKLRFSGAESAASVLHIEATNLREISGDDCGKIGDETFSAMASQFARLENCQLGPDSCERISSVGITQLALHCHHLQKLRLSGIRDISANAINALAQNCTELMDIGFLDCLKIDEVALRNVSTLRLLSVAGTRNMQWSDVLEHWVKLPNLVGLDVSRTDVTSDAVKRLLSSAPSLKVLCALNCRAIELNAYFTCKSNHKGKVLLALFTDILKSVADLIIKEKDSFVNWQNLGIKDKRLEGVMNWLEWVLSHSLISIIAASNPPELNDFWLTQGSSILLHLLQSPQEEVQERAAAGLATFVVIKDGNGTIDAQRAESVMRDGGMRLLLNLAGSWHEGLQKEAAKAIASLSVNSKVAKAVADEGGIDVIVKLARSMNRFIAEEAAGGLGNLSVGEEHKSAIVSAGGVQALVDVISKWLNGGEGVLERAAGALANLVADDKCCMEVASVGGIHALTTLLRTCKADGAREQAARALANLALHEEDNPNYAAVGQEPGAIEALVHLTQSPHNGARLEAARAVGYLSYDGRNRETIAAVGGIKALVTFGNSCLNSSPAPQQIAACALWGLSLSEANSIAIGREGGLSPLISFARSNTEVVHETAAGALWNLSLSPGNAIRIVEEGGVEALAGICSRSLSKIACFMAAMALAFTFDGRMDRAASARTVSLDGPRRLALEHIEAFFLTCTDQRAFSAASGSSTRAALAPITEAVRIHEAGDLICSESEIGQLVTMLQNSSSVLKGWAAFALLQFTVPGGRNSQHISSFLQRAGAPRVLRRTAAAATTSPQAKILAQIVLRNLEHHQTDCATQPGASLN